MQAITRKATAFAVAATMAIGVAAPTTILVESAAAAKMKRHCLKYKTVKGSNGKKVKRCAKYSK